MLDTCALSQIRRIERIGKKREAQVLKKLDAFIQRDELVFPSQVVQELGERKSSGAEEFPPHAWAKKHRKVATRFGPLWGVVKEVQQNPQVRRVLDPEKTKGADEADIHILALAYDLQREGYEVTVVTEDRKDKPMKLSLVTACAIMRVIALGMEAFLEQQGIVGPP